MRLNPTDQGAAIAAINPDEAQFLATATQPLENEPRPVTLLDRSGSDNNQQKQAERINQQMALAPFDLLVPILASSAFNLSAFDALRVKAASRRMLVASGLPT